MNKTAVIIVAIIFLGMIFWGWQSGFFARVFTGPTKAEPIPGGIILFYGDGCPHCENVDNFIEENNIKDKVSFSNLEVWYNKKNQNILAQIVKKCNLPIDQIGVPFLYDGQNCLIGEDQAIDFFKNEAGIQ